MKLIGKKKKPEYDHTEYGELGYDISVCYDNSSYMDIRQVVWHNSGGEYYDTPMMSVYKIPVADVKKALIEQEMKARGINGIPESYALKLVPKDDSSPDTVDVVGLKNYADLIKQLACAERGLQDARSAFGWSSEPAEWAEKRVSELKKQVDDAFKALTEGKLEE